MSLPTFKGGIHPKDSKSLTSDKGIEDLKPSGEFVYPMSQHIGAPCSPVVKKGERVLAGQKIGDAEAFVSAPILSSVSGTVKDIAARMTISGSMEQCIIIESDGEFENGTALVPSDDFRSLTPAECVKIVREA